MTNYLSTQTYDEIYDGLIEAKTWFRSIGVLGEACRFNEILSNVKVVRDQYNMQTPPDISLPPPIPELVISLLDAEDYINIHRQFRSLKNHKIPCQRIRAALSGPLLPYNEGVEGQSIHGRSALFELELAARFQCQGLTITGFDDIQLELCGVRINVQCKRPHKISRLQETIQNASSQISKRMGNTANRGLIALRIDRLLGLDSKILKVPDEDSLSKQSGDRLDQFWKEHKRKLKKIIDIRILGIFIDLPFIAEVENRNNLIVRGYESILYPLCSDSTLQFTDARLIEKLAEKVTVPPNL